MKLFLLPILLLYWLLLQCIVAYSPLFIILCIFVLYSSHAVVCLHFYVVLCTVLRYCYVCCIIVLEKMTFPFSVFQLYKGKTVKTHLAWLDFLWFLPTSEKNACRRTDYSGLSAWCAEMDCVSESRSVFLDLGSEKVVTKNTAINSVILTLQKQSQSNQSGLFKVKTSEPFCFSILLKTIRTSWCCWPSHYLHSGQD